MALALRTSLPLPFPLAFRRPITIDEHAVDLLDLDVEHRLRHVLGDLLLYFRLELGDGLAFRLEQTQEREGDDAVGEHHHIFRKGVVLPYGDGKDITRADKIG